MKATNGTMLPADMKKAARHPSEAATRPPYTYPSAKPEGMHM